MITKHLIINGDSRKALQLNAHLLKKGLAEVDESREFKYKK
jgi:hypothetical protein